VHRQSLQLAVLFRSSSRSCKVTSQRNILRHEVLLPQDWEIPIWLQYFTKWDCSKAVYIKVTRYVLPAGPHFVCVYECNKWMNVQIILRIVFKKGKGWYSSSWKPHLRATGRHLPYGITQCYLPPDTNVHRLTSAMQAGTGFTYPGGMEGWVDLVELIAPRPEIEPATFRSRVRRRTAARQQIITHYCVLICIHCEMCLQRQQKTAWKIFTHRSCWLVSLAWLLVLTA